MAWETRLVRKTKLRSYPRCLETLDAYADIAPMWQRACLFLYAALGTAVAAQFGVDMAAMWARGELVIQDIMAVTKMTPHEIAEKLSEFVGLKMQESAPLEFDKAKTGFYEQSFWPMAAHMVFAVQPSAIARLDFVQGVADSIATERAHVADLGCGPGVMLYSILLRRPFWTAQGLDISRAAVEYAGRLAAHKKVGSRVRFSIGDLASLRYPDASFDLVVASEVLEHVPAIETALAEIARILKPGGKVAITVPLRSRTALHVHSLAGQKDIERLCKSADLVVRRMEIRQYPGFGDDWSHAFVVAEGLERDYRRLFSSAHRSGVRPVLSTSRAACSTG